ncbi:phage tail protein [Megasphaera hexanoica]|uniref:Phage tail protein n=1 Tax=Megasphaera hexanoica TaxID=1675036 RepID=A0ABW7DPF8_9FIRM|nr:MULTISPECIES: phage tail protein [Megasphaera]AXB82779.1 hypothetical protein ACT01_11335 [Megasphaera hexanoica]KUH55905.1 hypothetical protein AT798_04835 [Megasphaera sp. DJF_B143]DAW26866.1 MAG TPA: hypothetical protein [Caudoviricetes sp.]
MYIGYMGSIIFGVSEHYLVTPDEVSRSGEARWQTHDLIMNKPVAQFIGPGQEELSFKLRLMTQYNATPERQLKTLREMRDNGMVFPLIIGGKPVSQNYWYLESVEEAEAIYNAYGRILYITANVKLKEYDLENTDEESSINKAGRAYNVVTTLVGGGL